MIDLTLGLTVLCLVLILYIGIRIYRHYHPQDMTGKKEKPITSTYISAKLEDDDDLK